MSQTDKEQAIAELLKKRFTDRKRLRLANEAYDAGYRAAKEDALKITEDEKVDAVGTGDDSDAAYNLACDHVAAEIRKLEPR